MMNLVWNKKKKGFTLIELIVVIAILGILAAVLIPRFTGFQDKARATQALVEAKNVATAIDGFYAEHNTWPLSSTETAEIATTSGVLETEWALVGTAGGFTVTTAVGSFKAGRASGTVPVKMNP